MNKPAKSPRVLKMHPEMGDLADQQMDADREWFINHPFATKYYRQPFECEVAEFAALEPGRKLKKMLVMKVDEGARARRPIFEDM
ncbi:hypothetical protein CLI64_30330 (plasmid) [Nostoc sp. CENA543]|uniref:hypothetical protein n=1 Tax=Nostoc sp. CENA543 TaxID=1869241 RepID=UPI000CA3B803|nr:hypothetical protein [Nostoc sp. CENA543]AUT04735.1 hypothetical protein CLI64_30330 [Nostoc sp. CENA543]